MVAAPVEINAHDRELPWMVIDDAEELSSHPSSGVRPSPNREALNCIYQGDQGPVAAFNPSLTGTCVSEAFSSSNTSIIIEAQSSGRRREALGQSSLIVSDWSCERTSHVEIDGHAFLAYKQSIETRRRNITVAVVVTIAIVVCFMVAPAIVFGALIKAR
jgi:hypothetical protein